MCCVVLCFPLALGIGKLVQLKCIALIVLNFTSFMRERTIRHMYFGLLFAQGIYYLCVVVTMLLKPKQFSWKEKKWSEIKQSKHKMWKENAHKLCIDYRVTSHSDVLLTFRFSADVTQIVRTHMQTYKWLSAFVTFRSSRPKMQYKFAIITAIDIS